MTRSADSARQLGAGGRRASPVRTRSRGPKLQPELVLGDLDDAGIELQHDAVGARAGRLEVPRHREPAAADVDGVDGLAGWPRRRRRRRRAAGCRRNRGTSGRRGRRRRGGGRRARAPGLTAASGSMSHAGAEVRRLDVARVAGQGTVVPAASTATMTPAPTVEPKRRGHLPPPRPQMPMPASTSSAPRASTTGSRRELGDEDEPGAEHPDQRAGRAERRQPPDHPARVVDGAQLQLDDQRRDGAEQGRRAGRRRAARGR